MEPNAHHAQIKSKWQFGRLDYSKEYGEVHHVYNALCGIGAMNAIVFAYLRATVCAHLLTVLYNCVMCCSKVAADIDYSGRRVEDAHSVCYLKPKSKGIHLEYRGAN